MENIRKKTYYCTNLDVSKIIYHKIYGENQCFCYKSAY